MSSSFHIQNVIMRTTDVERVQHVQQHNPESANQFAEELNKKNEQVQAKNVNQLHQTEHERIERQKDEEKKRREREQRRNKRQASDEESAQAKNLETYDAGKHKTSKMVVEEHHLDISV